MKRVIYAATVTLACLSAVSGSWISSVSPAMAYTAEESCEFTANPATTGGAIQQQIDAIARCNVKNQSMRQTQASSKIKDMSPVPANATTANSQNNLRLHWNAVRHGAGS